VDTDAVHVHGAADCDDATPTGDRAAVDVSPADVIRQTGERLHQSVWESPRRVGAYRSRPAFITSTPNNHQPLPITVKACSQHISEVSIAIVF